MATTVKVMSEQKRARYSAEYRAEALFARRASVGVAAAAARELGLHSMQIYQWRAKAMQEQSVSERERALREENARLKRQLAEKTEEVEILGKTAAYFAKKLD